MNCPSCGEKIEMVRVYSQCYQKALVDDDGNIIEWFSVEDILDTQGVECDECSADITSIIKE